MSFRISPGGSLAARLFVRGAAGLALLLSAGCGGESIGEDGPADRAATAVVASPPPAIGSLKWVPVPTPPNLGTFVASMPAALALGKALFWDMQAGSDGQACASCHFHAGADNRTKNQLNPGQKSTSPPPLGDTFDPTGSGGSGGPNYTLKPADFPTYRLANPSERNSKILFQTDDVVSSQGVFYGGFNSVVKEVTDDCAVLTDVFQTGGVRVRRVEPRQTPTVINAVFNYRNFWDGRANNVFNGVDPFGKRNPDAVIHVVEGEQVVPAHIALYNASLASQAVGPANSPFEMACEGRPFSALGRKLLARRPLAGQQVEPTDSVLASRRHPSGRGLMGTYADLVSAAFAPAYWHSAQPVDGHSLMEANFSLFWGLAIQIYEATLVSDDSRLDQFLEGNPSALTPQEQAGLEIFRGKGRCVFCHAGAELTSAGTLSLAQAEEGSLVERMIVGDGNPAVYDSGFYNIGVRPTREDLGLGGTDPWGNPLSFARQAKRIAAGETAPDPFNVDPATFLVNPGTVVLPGERDTIDGSFKVPTLRNVSLTGPYFHNGSRLTLEQVVEFYNRGGDRRGPNGNDSTGFGENPSNLDTDIAPIGLSLEERRALVAFLKSLTDERVRLEKAPFDHPQLFVPNGHPGNEAMVTNRGNGRATDALLEIPAVGAGGRPAKGLPPLVNFLN